MKKTNLFKRAIAVFISVLMVVSSLPFTAITASAAEENNEKFLFAYFTGDAAASSGNAQSQQIRLALSSDGINYTPLRNNAPIITPTAGTGNVRDPYIFKGQDGAYYVIGTDLDASTMAYWGHEQCQIILWKSTDLCNWTNETYINLAEICGLNPSQVYRTWAPEVIWDASLGAYMVYFAFAADGYNSTTMYYMTTTDLLDQSKYSQPQQLYNPGADAIDADIIKQNGVYYMFYKDEGQGTVSLATSNNVTGPYSFIGKFATSAATGGIEGCEVYQIGGNYYLVADRFGNNAGKFAIYNLGNDLSRLTTKGTSISVNDGNPITTVNETNGFENLHARHGSVVKIPYDMYKEMIRFYDGKTIKDDVYYNFDSNINLSGFNWAPQVDSSGFTYNLMTGHGNAAKSGGSNAYSYPNGNYLSLYGSNIFVEDESVRQIMSSDSWTVSYDAVISTIEGAILFGLTSGNANPDNTDWIRVLDNGKIYINTGTGTGANNNNYVEIGDFHIVETATYHLDIVYNGSWLYFYVDGELACSREVGKLRYNNSAPANYVAIGETDTNTKSFKGAIANLEFKNRALSSNEINYSVENANSLVWSYNEGTEMVDNRPYSTKTNGKISGDYTNTLGKSMSYTVAGWINPGDAVDGDVCIFEFGKGGDGAGKMYFNVMESGKWFYCWRDPNGTDHFFDGSGAFNQTLTKNTWYFLQINIHPYQDSTRISFFVNGVSTKSEWFNGRTQLRYHDYNLIDFFNQSSTRYRFGQGGAHWTGVSNAYIDDFRVYNKTIDPQLMYTYGALLNSEKELAQYRAENAKKLAEGIQDYSYSSAIDGKYGSYNGDKTGDFKSGTTYTTFERNVLWGQSKSSGDNSADTTLKANGGTGSNSNTHVWLKYPGMTLLYDGTTTLNTPMLIQINSNNGSTRYVYCATPAAGSVLGLEKDVWYGTDKSDNWSWLYSNEISNDIGRINAKAEGGVYARTAYNKGWAWENYNNIAFRWANMTKFNGGFAEGEYYKEVYPSYQVYVGSDTNYKTTDIAGVVTGNKPLWYINFKPVLDRVDSAKSMMNTLKTDSWMYTDASLQTYYEAVAALASFNLTKYSYDTHDHVVEAANAIKKAVEDFDKNAKLVKKVFTVTFFDANGGRATKSVTAGDQFGSFNANTATKYNNDRATHTVYTWDTDIKSTDVIREDVTISEKATKVNCNFTSNTTSANCTTNGSTVYTCSVCQGKYTEVIDALGHDFADYEANYTSGETYDANNTYEHTASCSRDCGATHTEACKFGEYVTTVEPTERENGYATATCACGGTVTRVLPKTGATTFTITFVDEEGTVLDTQDVEENEMPTPPQLPDNYKDIEGEHVYSWTPAIVAATANATYTVTDTTTPHTAFNERVVAPTCTEDGYTEFTCKDGCGYSYQGNFEDALGHDYTNVEYVSDGHGVHTRDCTRCDFVEENACTEFTPDVVEPTCLNRGYTSYTCVDCGYFYFSDFTDAKGHNTVDPVQENYVAPTCTEAGSYDLVTYCTNDFCDSKDKIAAIETIEVPATGHTLKQTVIPATCLDNAKQANACDNCDYIEDPIDLYSNEGIQLSVFTNSTLTNDGSGKSGSQHYDVVKSLFNQHIYIHSYGQKTDKYSFNLPIDVTELDRIEISGYAHTHYTNRSYVKVQYHNNYTDTDEYFTMVGRDIKDNHDINTTTSFIGRDAGNDSDSRISFTLTAENISTNAIKIDQYFSSGQDYIVIDSIKIWSKSHKALGHNNVTDARVEPTCIATGLTEGSHCDRCGDINVAQEVIPMKDHSYTGEAVHTDADGDANGYTMYRCVNGCNELGGMVYDTQDWSAYDAAVIDANTNIANTEKYTSDSIDDYSDAIDAITAGVTSGDSTKSEAFIKAKIEAILSSASLLKLNAFTVIFNYEVPGSPVETTTYNDVEYGTEIDLEVPTGVGSVYKWTRTIDDKDTGLAENRNSIKVVVTDNTTFTAYVADTTERVDSHVVAVYTKGGRISGVLYVNDGDTITVDSTDGSVSYKGQKITPIKTPCYNITGYKVGTNNIGSEYTVTRDVNLAPVYESVTPIVVSIAQESEGKPTFEGTTTTVYPLWDEKITLTAEKEVVWLVNGVPVAQGETYTFRATTTITITTEEIEQETKLTGSIITFAKFEPSTRKVRVAASSFMGDRTIKEQGLVILTSTEENKVFTAKEIQTKGNKYQATNTTDTDDQFSFTLNVKATSAVKTFGILSYVIYDDDPTVYYSTDATNVYVVNE